MAKKPSKKIKKHANLGGRPRKYHTEEERKEAQRERWRQWAARNPDKVRARTPSPAAMERAKARARDRKAATLASTVEEREARIAPEGNRTRALAWRRPRKVKMAGAVVVVRSLGWFCRFVGRSRAAVQRWFREDVLPGVTWQARQGRGISFFSKEYAQAVKDGIRSALKVAAHPTLADYRRHIAAVFRERAIRVQKRVGRK